MTTIREIAMEIKKSKSLPKLKEFLSTADASTIVPQIVVGAMKEAQEPLLIISSLFKKIENPEAKVVDFSYLGALKAGWIAQGQAYPEEYLDIAVERTAQNQVVVKKAGLLINIAQETIDDSQWDVLGMHLAAGGRALARFKEEQCVNEMFIHAHTVFDNFVRVNTPEAGTTGRNRIGQFNNTMSFEDFLDLAIAVQNNGYVITDLIMHPLFWLSYAKTGIFGGLAPAQTSVGLNSPLNAISATPPTVEQAADVIKKVIPYNINILLAPFAPLDKTNKIGSIFAVDRNEMGVIVQKEDVSLDQFVNPLKDITSIKAKERYGIGILNEGRAIAVAKNIALAPTYPLGYNIVFNIDETRIISGA